LETHLILLLLVLSQLKVVLEAALLVLQSQAHQTLVLPLHLLTVLLYPLPLLHLPVAVPVKLPHTMPVLQRLPSKMLVKLLLHWVWLLHLLLNSFN
jgi:hypothetical protein